MIRSVGLASLMITAILYSWGCTTSPALKPVGEKAGPVPVETRTEAPVTPPEPMVEASAVMERLNVKDPTIAQARELTEVLPGHPYPWLLLGLASLGKNDLATSSTAFIKALDLEPDHPTALLGLGEIAAREGNRAGMEAYYERAWETSGSIDASNRLAYVKILKQQPDLARKILEEALQDYPEDVTARNNLAVVLDLSGLSSEALELLESSAPPTAAIYETRAMIQLKEGHPELAGADVEAALAEGSGGPEKLLLLGILNLQRGNLAAAEESFRDFVDKHPGFYEGYLNLGLTLRRQGLFNEAEEVYKEGIREVENPDLHLNLGVLYELYLGKPDLALDNYRKFVELEGAESQRILGWVGYLSGLTVQEDRKEGTTP